MKQRAIICIACALAIVGIGGGAVDASDKTTADPYEGLYVGSFHPKRRGCGSCHAKAKVSRMDGDYVLKVDVDYTTNKRCRGETSRVFVIEGSSGSTNLVLRNKRYEVQISNEQIQGRRLYEKAEVPTVLQLKRSRPGKSTRAKPNGGPDG